MGYSVEAIFKATDNISAVALKIEKSLQAVQTSAQKQADQLDKTQRAHILYAKQIDNTRAAMERETREANGALTPALMRLEERLLGLKNRAADNETQQKRLQDSMGLSVKRTDELTSAAKRAQDSAAKGPDLLTSLFGGEKGLSRLFGGEILSATGAGGGIIGQLTRGLSGGLSGIGATIGSAFGPVGVAIGGVVGGAVSGVISLVKSIPDVVSGVVNLALAPIRMLGEAFNAVTGIVGDVLGKVGEVGKVVGMVMTIGITAPVVGSLGEAIKSSIDFDKTMMMVNSVTKLQGEEFQKLRRDILDFGTTTSQGAIGTAMAYRTIAAAGWEGADAMDILRVSVDAAGNMLSDAATSSRALGVVLRAFQLPASEAGHVMDVMEKAATTSAVRFDELTASIGEAAGVANAAGVSFEDTIAAIMTVTNVGFTTSEATTNVRAMLQNILKPKKELENLIKSWGFTTGLEVLQKEGIEGFLERVQKSTGGAADKVVALFTRIQGANAAFALMKNMTDTGSLAGASPAVTQPLTSKQTKELQTQQEAYKRMGDQLKIYQAQLPVSEEKLNKMIAGHKSSAAEINLERARLEQLRGKIADTQTQMEKAGVTIGKLTSQQGAAAATTRNLMVNEDGLTVTNGDFAKSMDIIATASDGVGTHLQMQEIRHMSVAYQLTRVKNLIELLAIDIGTMFLPAISSILSTVQGWITTLYNLDEPTKRTIVGIMLFAAALGPILLGAGTVILFIGSLVAGLSTLAPIALVAGGAILLISQVFGKDIMSSVVPLIPVFKLIATHFSDFLKAGRIFSEMFTRGTGTLTGKNFLESIFGEADAKKIEPYAIAAGKIIALIQSIPKVLEGVKEILTGDKEKGRGILVAALGRMFSMDQIAEIEKLIENPLPTIGGYIRTGWDKYIMPVITEVSGKLLGGLFNPGGLTDQAGVFLTKVMDSITLVVAGISNPEKSGLGMSLAKTGGTLGDAITRFLFGGEKKISIPGEEAVVTTGTAGGGAWDAVVRLMNQVMANLGAWLKDAKTVEAFTSFWNGFVGVMSRALSAVDFSPLTNAISDKIWNSLPEWLKGGIGGARFGPMGLLGGTIIGGAKDIGKDITEQNRREAAGLEAGTIPKIPMTGMPWGGGPIGGSWAGTPPVVPGAVPGMVTGATGGALGPVVPGIGLPGAGLGKEGALPPYPYWNPPIPGEKGSKIPGVGALPGATGKALNPYPYWPIPDAPVVALKSLDGLMPYPYWNPPTPSLEVQPAMSPAATSGPQTQYNDNRQTTYQVSDAVALQMAKDRERRDDLARAARRME